MTPEQRVNLFLTIMAYTSGAYGPKEVIETYEYILKEAKKADMNLLKVPKEGEDPILQ